MPIKLNYRKGLVYQEGKQQGLREAREEEIESIAFELHKMGLELAQISQATKLTIDHLKKLFNIY
jgi:predicted transposase YdaD